MNQYITLSKQDPLFQSYLLGTFSQSEVALPVQNLNVGTESEKITFEIKPKSEIKRPNNLLFYTQLFRVHNFIMVLFPLLLVLVKNYADHRLHQVESVFLAAFGVVCGFIAANLRNDYLDHLKGFDRIHLEAGSRSIQNGWITAASMRQLSYSFLALSLFLALPLVWKQPSLIFIILFALVISLWAQFGRKTSFKYQIGGELSVFILFGPLLTLGYQVAMGSGWDFEVLALGALWGWLLLFLIHLKNLSHLMPLSQGKFSNTITWMGFDRARGFISLWWFLFIVFYFLYHLKHAGLYWGWYLSLTLLFFSTRFWVKIKTLKSPIGSEVLKLNRIGRRLFLLAAFLWTLENIWYAISWNP
ncbi:MAG: prenyltransferase [Bdellovibrionia bacterium]